MASDGRGALLSLTPGGGLLRGRSGWRIWWRLGAGIYAAGTAASILGRMPIVGRQSWVQLIVRGVVLVMVPALVGAVVSRLLLLRELNATERAEFPFRKVALSAGVGWVLASPVALLLQRESHWAPLMMAVGAAVTAFAFDGLVRSTERVPVEGPDLGTRPQDELWPMLLLPVGDGRLWLALAMAASVEGAAIPLAAGEQLGAGLLLGGAAFIFAWRWAAGAPVAVRRKSDNETGIRAAGATLLAIVVAVLAVMMQLPDEASERGGSAPKVAARASADKSKEKDGTAVSGYKGIILWAPPEKKERIVAPRLLTAGELQALEHKPVVIPFDGAYWYFQAPHTGPGRDPHVAHGDPWVVNIRSVNQVPLMMEAHQKLANAIQLSCCAAIRVDLRNGDNETGQIVLGLVLTDSLEKGKPSLPLAGERVPSSEPERFAVKRTAVADSVVFKLPDGRALQRFDEITVVYFPAERRDGVGPKIGIEDFVLLPR